MSHRTDWIVPELLDPLLVGTMFAGHVHHVLQAGSTNAMAMEAAIAGAPQGSVYLAEEQLAGRGRGGHAWHSEPSRGILCSVVLRPERRSEGHAVAHAVALAPAETLVLSLCAGLAAQTAIEQVAHVRPDLRWPNDLLLNGKKVGGILVELNSDSRKVRFVVVGMGINVNQENFPPELQPLATSLLLETGRPWSRLDLAAALLESLDHEYRLFCGDARESILGRFEANSSYARGKPVRVEENGGFQGITDGLDERGFLRVRTREGIIRIVLSGGVREMGD